jgi:hypothetical protein
VENDENKTWRSINGVYAYTNRSWYIMHVIGQLIAERIYS